MYHPVTMQVFDNLNPRCLRMPLSLTVKHILSAGIRLLSESLIVAIKFPAGCDLFSCLFNYFCCCCCCCCCVFCFSYLTCWFLKLVKQFESEINHSNMVRQFKLTYRKSIASRSNWSEKFCSEKFCKIHTQAPAMVSSEVTFTFPKIIAPSHAFFCGFWEVLPNKLLLEYLWRTTSEYKRHQPILYFYPHLFQGFSNSVLK